MFLFLGRDITSDCIHSSGKSLHHLLSAAFDQLCWHIVQTGGLLLHSGSEWLFNLFTLDLKRSSESPGCLGGCVATVLHPSLKDNLVNWEQVTLAVFNGRHFLLAVVGEGLQEVEGLTVVALGHALIDLMTSVIHPCFPGCLSHLSLSRCWPSCRQQLPLSCWASLFSGLFGGCTGCSWFLWVIFYLTLLWVD